MIKVEPPVTFGRFFILAFFLLIFSNAIVISAAKFGALPGKPVYYYAFIATGLLVTAALSEGSRTILDERLIFGLLVSLVAIGLFMYRGDAGPDFGGKVLYPLYIPSRLGTALWPLLNLIAASALYAFARNEKYRPTILRAAFATLIILALTMEADLWWPAIFGDPNGRAAGLAQNANTAALLVTVLASIFLPPNKGDQLNAMAVYAALIAAAAVAFTQSKAGMMMVAILVVAIALAKLQGSSGRKRSPVFIFSYLVVIAVTVILSPVLHGTVAFPHPMIMGTQLPGATAPNTPVASSPLQEQPEHYHNPSETDVPLPLSERLESRASVDDSSNFRLGAFLFYSRILKDHIGGLGTGFTNKFVTGPHNSFLKLAVDNGIIAAVLLLALLGALSWRSFRTRSPQLISLTAITWLAAMFYHTLLVDPIVLPALAVGLGFIRQPHKPR